MYIIAYILNLVHVLLFFNYEQNAHIYMYKNIIP